MQIIHQYKNGNGTVSIYDNGTKIREFDGAYLPEHPESCDVKITSKCDVNCRFCHEKSSINGKHADLNKLLEVLKDIPAGVECAIGGGNAQQHPDVIPFLRELKSRGLIANMTINQKHLNVDKDIISLMLKEELIKGLGISYSDPKYLPDLLPFLKISSNIVFHTIMGINSVDVIGELLSYIDLKKHLIKDDEGLCKILVLGYKEYGFGQNHYSLNQKIVDENKLKWYRYLPSYFTRDNLVLSFDNLSIQQLNLKRFFTDEAWDKFYMGNEGSATMYIDAVNQEYAICSVDPNRKSFSECSLLEFFKNIPR